MYSNKSKLTLFVLIFIMNFSFANVFALSWSQKTIINNNRSGKVMLTYWTATSDLKGDDFFKSLPFTEDKIRSTFSSANNTIDGINIKRNPDTTRVNIVLSFKIIQDLNKAPGFSNAKITWYINGDSTIFMYKMDKNTDFSNNSSISYVFELPTKEIMRTSGIKEKGNNVVYGLSSESMANGAGFFVVFRNSEENLANTQKQDTNSKNTEKGCGLFGIELPLIFGFGLLFMKRKVKK